MYYSSAQTPPSLFDPGESRLPTALPPPRLKPKIWLLGLAGFALVVGGLVTHRILHKHPAQKVASVSSTITPVPSRAQVAGVSFGDLLKKQPSYQGWLAG